MRPNKTVLTTGEVARVCSVAPRTVSKWFDSGQLRGYRIPGSKDRRIPLEQLIRFMRAHGIPLAGLDTGQRRVLILEVDVALRDGIQKALANGGGYEVLTASSAIEAGALAQEAKPHVFIMSVMLPDIDPKAVVRWARSSTGLQEMSLLGIGNDLAEGRGEALLQDGFHGYLNKPFDVRSLIELIEEASGAVASGRNE